MPTDGTLYVLADLRYAQLLTRPSQISGEHPQDPPLPFDRAVGLVRPIYRALQSESLLWTCAVSPSAPSLPPSWASTSSLATAVPSYLSKASPATSMSRTEAGAIC